MLFAFFKCWRTVAWDTICFCAVDEKEDGHRGQSEGDEGLHVGNRLMWSLWKQVFVLRTIV